MATKIGYNPQLANTGIDWVTVGTDVANTLKLQEEAREKTRVEAKAALQKEIKDLAATELGKDAQANQWIMNGVDAITSTALIDQKLWQSGALSTKDYTRNRANRKNGTELVLQAFNTFNKDYDAVMEGINSGELSSKTLDLRAQVESLFDFGKTGIYINPNDGEVNVAKKDLVDGVYRMSDNPDEFLNASELMQAATAKFQRFKAKEEAAALAESVAQNVLRTVGGTSIQEAYLALDGDEATQKKLNDARLDQVKSILTNEKAGSFLADYLKEGYSFTRNKDEADADPKKILINQDGSTNFEDSKHGKEQYDYAVKKFDELLETYLPKKKQFKTETEGDIGRKTTGKSSGQIVTSLAIMQSGKTLEERVLSASDIAGRDNTIIKIVETPDEILVTRQAATKGAQPITTPYPRGVQTIGFVQGAASGLTGVEDLNTAIRNSSLTEGMVAAPITETAVLFERTTPPKPPSGLVRFDAQLNADFNPNVITDEDFTDDATVMGKLAPIATKYGVTIENPTRLSGDSLIFKIGSGNNEITQEVDFSETGKEGLLEALKGFIKSNKDATERFLALESDKPPAY